jgi:AraC-like DNA-binding protein
MLIKHIAGSATVKIDMDEYVLTEPVNTIQIAPGQILSVDNASEDFDVVVMLMSRRFVEGLLVYVNGSIPFRFGKNVPHIVHCSVEEDYFTNVFNKAIRRIIQDKSNPFRKQVVQHVMMAVFYSSEKTRMVAEDNRSRSNADVLSQEFVKLVKEHFRKERQLKFYADKLCITPRYLSRVVKECTGSSAAEWIELTVVLEARALLKSTNMTVQQISDELNFPSQTFFGKYFKRRVGMSPKEYRRLG